LYKRALVLFLLLPALSGCGGGKSPSNTLFTVAPGAQWVYQVSGFVTFPGSGGSVLPLDSSKSSFIISVDTATVKDANNVTVNILNRNLDLFTQDGREVKAYKQIFVSQNGQGIFLHGYNDGMGSTIDAAKSKFVPAAATPSYAFLYLPSPAVMSSALTYSDPFGSVATGSYSALISEPFQQVTVPAGSFFAKPLAFTENFDGFAISSGFLTPDQGIISGNIALTLADGSTVSGVIQLKSIVH
jgi:hypothetical protein